MSIENKKIKAAFLWIITILKKHKIPYRISGGFAARIYGSKRPVADIDIDMPDRYIDKILPEVYKYILYGPNRYKDREWNIYALELKYKGQEIGLAGTTTGKIFDKKKGRWTKFKADFSKINKKKVYGKEVKVIGKKDLIAYKSKIQRRVDKQDVKELTKNESNK